MEEKYYKSSDLKHDQRIQVLLLHEIGWTYNKIATQLEVTRHQVQYACEAGHTTPAKRLGRPSVLSSNQIQTLVEFIHMFFENC